MTVTLTGASLEVTGWLVVVDALMLLSSFTDPGLDVVANREWRIV